MGNGQVLVPKLILVSGFLGAGKTTLIVRAADLLRQCRKCEGTAMHGGNGEHSDYAAMPRVRSTKRT